jgi:transcriptional regulator with XRE-family HTH domain
MNKIDIFRRNKCLSYAALSRETGLTQAYIQQLAKGKRRNPSLNVMQKIAFALGEKVGDVFSFEL